MRRVLKALDHYYQGVPFKWETLSYLYLSVDHTHLIALLVYIFTTKVADVRVDKPVYWEIANILGALLSTVDD